MVNFADKKLNPPSEHSICRCACLKLRTIAEGEVTSVAILPADEGLQHHLHDGDE